MPTGFITHTFCSKHLTGNDSPESPVRTTAVEEQLMASGLGYAFERIEDTYKASEADILRAHDADYLQRIKDVLPKKLGETAHLCADTIISHHSLEAALSSAGCVIDATKRVLSKQLANAFCCVRPPGHHAGRHGGSGFCIFNNIAIAALYALDVLKVARVAIVDFDAHHGDGTEDILKNRPGIRLFSLFQEGIFPHVGQNSSASNVVNTPLQAGDTGEKACELIRKKWIPAIREFKPDLIFVAAGFDAHSDEVMADLDFSEIDYASITRLIDSIAHEVCDGRIVSVLEGGYNPRTLARSVLAHIRTLAHV
ncbi:MAG: histone deacetylase family protein [Burkholderiaceae bacterium]|nr:histone deacetylase family protein [Burkholderiaceae bacterium]